MTRTPDLVWASAGAALGQISLATSRPLSEPEGAQPTPEACHESDVFQKGGVDHSRTRLGGEQRVSTVKLAEADEAALTPLLQVTAWAPKCPQLAKLRAQAQLARAGVVACSGRRHWQRGGDRWGAPRHTRAWSVGAPAAVADCRRLGSLPPPCLGRAPAVS